MTAELLFDELGFIQSTYLGTLWYECEYQEVFFNLPQLDNGKCPFCNSNVKEVDVQPLYPQEDVKEALAVRVLRFLNKEDYEPRM